MTTTITRNITRYDSLSEIADKGRAGVGSSKSAGRGGWYGTDNYEAVVTLAADGWKQGGEKINLAIEKIKPQVAQVTEVLSRISYMHTPNRPGVLDVGRYAAGHPYHMVSPILTSAPPIVKIAVPALWSAAVSTDRIMEAGGADRSRVCGGGSRCCRLGQSRSQLRDCGGGTQIIHSES